MTDKYMSCLYVVWFSVSLINIFFSIICRVKQRERSKSLPQTCKAFETRAGITCSNQDLSSILSSSKPVPEPQRRKSISVLPWRPDVTRLIDGFGNRGRRRVSSRSISLVTWDEDVQIDPLTIGSSIETYLTDQINLASVEEEEKDSPRDNYTNSKMTITIYRKNQTIDPNTWVNVISSFHKIFLTLFWILWVHTFISWVLFLRWFPVFISRVLF